jgi:hypothetical protein
LRCSYFAGWMQPVHPTWFALISNANLIKRPILEE